MPTLRIERLLPAPLERVFAFITEPGNILNWWGPEGMTLPEAQLDFSRTGPWMSVMQNAEGQRYKVSGHVTHVDPPHSVCFTWAWHDESDRRGVESHVTIRLVLAKNGGTALTLSHADLPDADSAGSHEKGWNSALRKLHGLAEAG